METIYDRLSSLTEEYKQWCTKNDLPPDISADEMLYLENAPETTAEQKAWLVDFIERWNKADSENADLRVFTITENGFSMTDDKVSVPACRIKAASFLEASEILNEFLRSRIKPDSMELITPMERISFE